MSEDRDTRPLRSLDAYDRRVHSAPFPRSREDVPSHMKYFPDMKKGQFYRKRADMIRSAQRKLYDVNVSRDVTDWVENIADFTVEHIEDVAHRTVQKYAPIMEDWIKSNKRWRDRTGDAVNNLTASAISEPYEYHSVQMSHGMYYGFWLETSFNGRYTILRDARDFFFDQIVEDFSRELQSGR